MHTVPDSSVPADRESAQAHGRWIRVVELPRIELGSSLLSTFACCHVRRGVYLHLRGEGHPWTGAFGEPRTACRRCSYTGRANPSSDCPTSPIQIFRFQPVNRQWGGWNRVSHCEGETVKRNVVGVWGLIPACTGKVLVMGLLTVAPISLQHVANGFQQAIANLSAPMIWVGWREQQPFNPCLYCCHLAGVAYDPRSCPHAHAG